MSETNLTDAIAAVRETAAAHAAALRMFGAVAGYDVAGGANRVEADAKQWTRSAALAAAESARPKGPTVRIVWVKAGDVEGSAGTEELIRTTPKGALMKSERRYDLATGDEIKAGGFYSRKRRIRPDDLATVRAMKPGHNDVSKALAAIKVPS